MKTEWPFATFARAASLLLLVLLLALPAALHAQDYTYTTSGGRITITGYHGAGGAVTIPSAINGLPVTRIGDRGFRFLTRLTNITIGNSVTSIGSYAFASCSNLTSVAVGNSVARIENAAFENCFSLTNLTIPKSVTSLGDWAFYHNSNLASVYFQGNAPARGLGVFDGDIKATVYYLPGSKGWGPTFGGRPTVSY